MTPTTSPGGEGGVVRIPADLDRPDRILGGLTARQLAILTAGGVAAWTLEGLLEPLVGRPAAAVLAAPLALAAMALALGWRDDSARDAWVDYAYVVAPDRLQMFTSLHGGWQPIADPAWTDTPDWEAIDRHAKQLRRQY